MRAKLVRPLMARRKSMTASHLVVFAAKNNFSEADVDAHIEQRRGSSRRSGQALAPLRGMLVGGIVKAMDETARNAWARNQAYIALGNF